MTNINNTLFYNPVTISSFEEFFSFRGDMQNDRKTVLFYRMTGTNPGYFEDFPACEKQFLSSHPGCYVRLSTLSPLSDSSSISFYSEGYQKWILSNHSRLTLKISPDDSFQKQMCFSYLAVLEEYKKIHPHTTASQEKNFMVKMFFWTDEVLSKMPSPSAVAGNLKISACNIEKKQEYLFFYFLTLLGMDVLLLQTQKDISRELEALKKSEKFVAGPYSNTALPDFINEPPSSHPSRKENPSPSFRHRTSAAPDTAFHPSGPSPGQENVRIHIPRHPGRNHSVSPSSQSQPLCAGVSDIPKTEKSYEELALSASCVVMIACHDVNGEVNGTGSGIMIGKNGYILTNYHVACHGKSFSIKIENDDTIYTTDELIKYHTSFDLALLRIDKKLTPLPIYQGEKRLVRGQKVVAIGSPLGLFNSVSDGIISGFRTIDHVEMIQFTAPTSQGSSGGAVLNMNGEVIGISSAGIDNGQNINLAVGYEDINTFIRGFTE